MKVFIGVLGALGVLSSWAMAEDFVYSETMLESELREKVACLSAGTCTPDISGFLETGEVSNDELKNVFAQMDNSKVISFDTLNVAVDINDAEHHYYDSCESLLLVIENELLLDNTVVSLNKLTCNAGLGYGAENLTLGNTETTILGNLECEAGNCPKSFFNDSDFWAAGDIFPVELEVSYEAIATPLQESALEIDFNVEIIANYTASSFKGELALIKAITLASDNSSYNAISHNLTGSFTNYDTWQSWQDTAKTYGDVSITQTNFASCDYAVTVLKANHPELFDDVTNYQCPSSSNSVLSIPSGSGLFTSAEVSPMLGLQLCENGNCPSGVPNGFDFTVIVKPEKTLILQASTAGLTTAPVTVSYQTTYVVKPAEKTDDYQLMIQSVPMDEYAVFEQAANGGFTYTGTNNTLWSTSSSLKTSYSGDQTMSTSDAHSPIIVGCDKLRFKRTIDGDIGEMILDQYDIESLVSSCDQISVKAPYAQSNVSNTLAATWSLSGIQLSEEIDVWNRYAYLLQENIVLREDVYNNFRVLEGINYNDSAVVASYMKTLSSQITTPLETYLLFFEGMSASEIQEEITSILHTSGVLSGVLKYSTGDIDKPAYWDGFLFSPFGSLAGVLEKETAIRTLYAAMIDDSVDQTLTGEIFAGMTNAARVALVNEVDKSNWFLNEYVASAQSGIRNELETIKSDLNDLLSSIAL